MPNPYLPRGRRSGGLTYTLPVGTPSSVAEDSHSGLFGLGFGPDVDLGLRDALAMPTRGLEGLLGAVSDLAPGGKPAGARWSQMAKGTLSSLAGTGLTAAQPFTSLAQGLGDATGLYDVDFQDKAERAVGRFLGDEERYRAETFFERVGKRGLLPAVVETVGDVALIGGAATAPLRAASTAAKLAGAGETATRLAATRLSLLENPVIHAMQHPYLTAGDKVLTNVLRPAAEATNLAAGIRHLDDAEPPATEAGAQALPEDLDVSTPPEDLGLDATPEEAPVATTTPEPAPPVGAGTRFLAGIHKRIQGIEAGAVVREQARMAEMERQVAGRSEAVRTAAHAARTYVIDAGKEQGLNISRREASLIIGDEVRSRLTGTKAIEDEYLARGVPESEIIRAGVRERFVPEVLRNDPFMHQVIDEVVAANKIEAAKTRQTLEASRPGTKGLTGLADETAMEPALTPKQQKALTLAQKKLARAESDVLARKAGRERASWTAQQYALEDKLGRIAAESQRVADQGDAAVADFELARTMRPRSWRADGAMEASTQTVFDETVANVAEHVAKGEGEWGGASYNPHTGQFIRAGSQPGYAVGLVAGDGRLVDAAAFTPQDIEMVVRAHQDVYAHPDTIVGTWQSDGKVAIDPAEVVPNLDDALIRAAARGQDAIYDIANDKVVDGILKDRPEVAKPFVAKHTNLSNRMRELRRISQVVGWDDDTVNQLVGLEMIEANAAKANGTVAHPDDFFKTHTFKAGKRASKVPGVFNQVVLERVIGKPLWDEAIAAIQDVPKTRNWYRRSNQLVTGLLANQPEVTLLNGTKIDATDLAFQIIAASSVNEGPRNNWTKAMRNFQAFDDLPKDVKKLAAPLRRLAAGKATPEEAIADVVKYLEDRGTGSVPLAKQYVAEILAGNTLDKWTAETITAANDAVGLGARPDRAKALAFIEANYPDVIERIGEDAAIKEFWGQQHRAKIMSFYDNLAHPDTSSAVTWDTQMHRLVGEDLAAQQGGWLRGSEQMRDLAAELSETMGETVTPSEIQAVFWVFAKEEIARIEQSHYRALAEDAAGYIRAGVPITDDIDPILTWADEAGEAFTSPDAKFTRPRRLLRDPDAQMTPPPVVENAAYGANDISALFPEDGLRSTVPWPQAAKSKDFDGFNQRIVNKAVEQADPALHPIDPRTLLATQPQITRSGVDYYLSGKYEETGKTFADATKGGNAAPTVYIRPNAVDPTKAEHVLLTGHHRAAAALLRGEPLQARIIEGPWGEVRPGRPPRLMARRAGETVEPVTYMRRLASATKREGAAIIDKRKARWLAARDEINASLAVGDVDKAMEHFNAFDEFIRTRAPRAGGMLNDAGGGDFQDIWMDERFWSDGYLNANKEFNRLDWLPGEMPLLQAFRDKILGQFAPANEKTRATIRFFEDADPTTFVHENGHLLRTMLTEPQMNTVERLYGIKNGVWEVAHEERWANDFVNYFRTGKAPKGLQSTFQRIRQVLRDHWDMVRGTFYRRTVPPELRQVFDEWLNPAVEDVDMGPYPGLDVTPETGTMRQRAARPPKFPQPPAYFAAGRKGQAALARLEQTGMRQRQLTATAAKVQKTLDGVRSVLTEGRLPSELERDTLVAQARQIQDKVAQQLQVPSTKRTPARWAPLWQATQDLAKIAEGNPAFADMLDDLPQTLHDIQSLALSKGFDPVHVRDFTPTQVRRLVFGNMRLGLGRDSLMQQAEAGTRKSRTGALARAGGVDRSVESFLAASVEATIEKRTNAVVDWIEGNAARKIAKGAPIPEGWQAWDPVRTYILTGTELTEDGMRSVPTAASDVTIVPNSVVSTVNRYTKDYDHWALRGIRKVTSPWRTLVLTLSPGWYVRNFAGNVMLAEAEGVRLQDWKAAWRSANTKDEIGRFADLPFVTSDTLAGEAAAVADDSLIPRRGFREAQAEGGPIRGAVQHATRTMLRANEVVDEIARAAVYHQGVRLNMSPEQAWSRAKQALVDYGALTPFEKTAVRAVIPFYAWQKGILKVTLHQALDHPARTELLALMGQVQDDYVADRLGLDPEDVPDYYKHLVGSYNLKSFNPFADAADILSVEGITRSFNPFIELAIRKGLGAPEFYTDKQRLGYFGSPQADVDVPAELREMLTRSPGGRIIGDGPGTNLLGLTKVDDDALRSRLLRARRQIRGIPNPETGSPQAPLLRAG